MDRNMLEEPASLRVFLFALLQRMGGEVFLPAADFIEPMNGPENAGILHYEVTAEGVRLGLRPPESNKNEATTDRTRL